MKERMKKVTALCLAAALSVGTVLPVHAETVQDAQNAVDQLQQQKDSVQAEKTTVETELKKIAEEMEKTQSKLDAKQAEITEAEENLVQAKVEENTQYESMKIRIKYMYENVNMEFIEVRADRENISDFLNKTEYISKLSEYDGEETFSRFDMIMPENYRTFGEWMRFANSLRLRLAIRIAMADPDKARDEAHKSLTHPAGLLEEAYEVVAVSTAGTGYSNPLGEINKAWGEVFMNANMESILKGYKDPRLSRYFEPATGQGYSGEYRGIRQGTGFNHSRYSEHSRSTITQKTDAILMTPAEVWFLRAEAALRGWSGEDAGTCYEQGVRSSFNQWRVGEANAYLQSDHVAADFVDTFTPDYSAKALCLVSPAWDEEASRETKLEKIITQKWIACYPEGCEAWAEQRRTGYPRLFPVLVNKSNGKIDTRTMIRRLNFPVSIISGNPAQYSALCEYLGGPDAGGTRLWWDTGVNFRD